MNPMIDSLDINFDTGVDQSIYIDTIYYDSSNIIKRSLTSDEILERLDIQDIESFLRKKKLEKIKNNGTK